MTRQSFRFGSPLVPYSGCGDGSRPGRDGCAAKFEEERWASALRSVPPPLPPRVPRGLGSRTPNPYPTWSKTPPRSRLKTLNRRKIGSDPVVNGYYVSPVRKTLARVLRWARPSSRHPLSGKGRGTGGARQGSQDRLGRGWDRLRQRPPRRVHLRPERRRHDSGEVDACRAARRLPPQRPVRREPPPTPLFCASHGPGPRGRHPGWNPSPALVLVLPPCRGRVSRMRPHPFPLCSLVGVWVCWAGPGCASPAPFPSRDLILPRPFTSGGSAWGSSCRPRLGAEVNFSELVGF